MNDVTNNNEFELSNNHVEISGTVVSEPVFSHEMFGENFFECNIQSNRLSGKDDILPVTISDRIGMEVHLGDKISVLGQVRSYNKFDESVNRTRLVMTVFARDVRPMEEGENDKNEVYLKGFLCKSPVYRTTPFNREICDILLACNRAYKKSDYIPIIVWGRNARTAKDFAVGDEIEIGGRMQSRDYVKQVANGSDVTQERRVAYEISVSSMSNCEQSSSSQIAN